MVSQTEESNNNAGEATPTDLRKLQAKIALLTQLLKKKDMTQNQMRSAFTALVRYRNFKNDREAKL